MKISYNERQLILDSLQITSCARDTNIRRLINANYHIQHAQMIIRCKLSIYTSGNYLQEVLACTQLFTFCKAALVKVRFEKQKSCVIAFYFTNFALQSSH